MTHTHRNTILVSNWLYFTAFMVFCMAIIGAITRLTESGLSMVEWRPLIGAIPPLNAAEWDRVFQLYRDTPEYQKINTGMSLDEFKNIFFWEWFHRVWGRLIGLVYALPLAYFWIRKMIPAGYKKPLLGLLVLGGCQAVMGYIMVLSGLADRPAVSHYKLAAHLSLAFVIFGYLIWTAMALNPPKPEPTTFCKRRHGWSAMAILAVTIIWGAFMAGKDAGLVSSSWPHMYDGVMIPNEFRDLSFYSFMNNEAIIHFTHRWIAVLALVMIATFAWRVQSFPIGGMVFIQFALGIMTVMSYVAIPMAAMHQGGAFILTALLLRELYKIRKG
jgi:cytochrome c oxidase assembly protein subunit 15